MQEDESTVMVDGDGMGPELDLKEKSEVGMEILAGAENGGMDTSCPEHKLVPCASNSEDRGFHFEALDDGEGVIQDGSENVEEEIDIVGCRNSGDSGRVEAGCAEDTVESMSSFGDTTSKDENRESGGISDTEVESQFCDGYGGACHLRKKKVTDHWRSFIRPLMWRCKWIELHIKEFQSQALKYDRELAEHEQRKQFDFETFLVEGFDAKSLPFPGCVRRNKVMKRKKRKRYEDTTDLASYMRNHNLFSYYEHKRSDPGCSSVDVADCDIDKTIEGMDDFGSPDALQSVETMCGNNVQEHLLRKIEVLQSQVHKLKGRIKKVVSENPLKFASINMLSTPSLSNALTTGDLKPASPENIGVSGHAEVTLPDTIGSTDHPQTVVSCEKTKEEVPSHSRAEEEMQNFKNVLSEVTEKQQIQMEPMPASEAVLPRIAPRMGYGGKSLPKSRTTVSNTNRRRGKRKPAAARWSRRSSG